MSERRSAPPQAMRAAMGAVLALRSLSPLQAADLTIRHDPPGCVLANAFPRLLARVEPAGEGTRVRVAFRPDGARVWHGATAEPAADGFVATLPRPRLSARMVLYRFEATGSGVAAATSIEYSATVVADAGACAGALADSVQSARVLVDVPPGAPLVPPVPAGFDPVGAVSSAPHRSSGKKE